MKRRLAHYSLHALDFFDLTVKKICDIPVADDFVCNSVRTVDVLERIAEHEQTLYLAACVAGRLKHNEGFEFNTRDVYVTHVDWVKQGYDELEALNDSNHHYYDVAHKFITEHKVLAAYGVYADETDTYLLVVEYTEIDV